MDSKRLNRLHDLGISTWASRADARRTAAPAQRAASPSRMPEPVAVAAPSAEVADARARAIAAMDWSALKAAVSSCTICGLRAGCTQTVFGVGDESAKWMIVGEAPGADEDRQGEPFVGRAGQLLNSMIGAMGMKREQVYIANILKCRPPNNRDPKPEEAELCRPHLERQIALIKPRLILAVGRIAAQNLLHTDVTIGRLRGTVHRLGETPVVVTYHPAYLLRSPGEKRKSWDDLKLAMDVARQGAI
ncbi:MAG TPA: uracil-DNA glycosylase [Gammaproteobacteria bacterium]|jgi:DNA polymerase